jgi:PAS domain-containing protein
MTAETCNDFSTVVLDAASQEFPIEASISQIEVAGQSTFTVILRDITDRKRAEDDLSESETKLQTIVESLTEGLAVSDLAGRLLHFNRAALDLHGFASVAECHRHLSEFADTFELSDLNGTIWPVNEWPLARVLRGDNVEVASKLTQRRPH